ncbi:hypothetical protein KC352_g9600, partial [Hortaea werneckii]
PAAAAAPADFFPASSSSASTTTPLSSSSSPRTRSPAGPATISSPDEDPASSSTVGPDSSTGRQPRNISRLHYEESSLAHPQQQQDEIMTEAYDSSHIMLGSELEDGGGPILESDLLRD